MGILSELRRPSWVSSTAGARDPPGLRGLTNWVSRAEGLGLGVEVTVGDSGRVESSEEPRSVC